jgi:hypothetical protein
VRGFLEELPTKEIREIQLNINQLRHLTGMLEHYCHLIILSLKGAMIKKK